MAQHTSEAAASLTGSVTHHNSPFLTPSSTVAEPSSLNVLILLNTPIPAEPLCPIFKFLWNKCTDFRVCADGAANRLYQATVSGQLKSPADPASLDPAARIPNGAPRPRSYFPDMIVGDLDSIMEHVRSYYSDSARTTTEDGPATQIVCVQDQYSTDFEKSLQAVLDRYETDDKDESAAIASTKNAHVFVYGGFGGRFDHEMANFQTLYKWTSRFGSLRMYNDQTCAWLLSGAISIDGSTALSRHEIRVPPFGHDRLGEGPTCGLIPLGAPCRHVRTQGLRWNLGTPPDLDSTAFGGPMVSTSNHMEESLIIVECSDPLVFTAEMQNGIVNH
jgi:thiamine pyrophosphokinase